MFSETPRNASEARQAKADPDAKQEAGVGLWADFTHSLGNSLKSQANGAIQLANHFGAGVAEFAAKPVDKATFLSPQWAAETAGQVAAAALEFGALRLGFRALAGGGIGVSSAASSAERMAALTGEGTAGITAPLRFTDTFAGKTLLNAGTGAFMGGILTPGDSGNFWTDRGKHILTYASAFGAMGAVSAGAFSAAALTDRPLLAAVLRNGYANNFAGGFVGGGVGAQIDSSLNGRGWVGWQEAGRQGLDYALLGMGAHTLDLGAGALWSKFAAKPNVQVADGYIDFAKLPKPWARVRRSLEYQRANPSAWYDTVSAEKRFATLQGDTTSDVAVIGGGIAGLQTAHLLAKNGFRVSVVEGNRIASGATSQMAAMVDRMPDWGFKAITKYFGEQKGGQIIRDLRAAHDTVIDQATNSDSDFTAANTYKLATRRQAKHTQEEVHTALSHDPDFGFIQGEEIAKVYPNAKYAGVAYREGMLNPRKFALSLASSGDFRVYEDSPAIGLTVGRAGEPITVHTPEGSITANKVVFATGGAPPLFSWLNRRLWTAQVHAMRTQYDGHIEGNFVSSRDPSIDFWRMMGPNELLFGGDGRPLILLPPVKQDLGLIKRMNMWAPGGKPETAKVWNGTIFITDKYGLPIIGQDPARPDVYAITGLGGSGLVNSALAAKMVLLELQGKGDQNPLAVRRR